MAITFGFFTDSALTTALSGNLVAQQNADGSSDPVDFTLYLGSTTASRKIEADSDPGVANIAISVVDSASGSGHPATEVKLATTLGGLDTATGGDPLTLGTSILSGSGNAQVVYVRVDDTTGVIGNSTELSITTNTLRETSTA